MGSRERSKDFASKGKTSFHGHYSVFLPSSICDIQYYDNKKVFSGVIPDMAFQGFEARLALRGEGRRSGAKRTRQGGGIRAVHHLPTFILIQKHTAYRIVLWQLHRVILVTGKLFCWRISVLFAHFIPGESHPVLSTGKTGEGRGGQQYGNDSGNGEGGDRKRANIISGK